jgi:hypothetical protein
LNSRSRVRLWQLTRLLLSWTKLNVRFLCCPYPAAVKAGMTGLL